MSSQVCISFAHNYCCLAYSQANQHQVDLGVFYDDLKEKVSSLNKVSAQTLLILAGGDYQLLIAKKPDVPEAKMHEALLWQEQARFSLPLDQIILEYFECRETKGEKKLYVVAVAKQQLQNKYQLVSSAGLKVARITIPELVYASYVQQELSNYACVTWVNLFPDQSRALFFVNGGLASTLRLPKLEQSESQSNQQAIAQALNLFYHEKILPFINSSSVEVSDNIADSVAWVINSSESKLAKALASEKLPGKIVLPSLSVSLNGDLSLSNEIAISHASYGVVTEK